MVIEKMVDYESSSFTGDDPEQYQSLILEGRLMMSLLPPQNAEAILMEIQVGGSAVANAIRQKLAQHAIEIGTLIQQVESSLDQRTISKLNNNRRESFGVADASLMPSVVEFQTQLTSSIPVDFTVAADADENKAKSDATHSIDFDYDEHEIMMTAGRALISKLPQAEVDVVFNHLRSEGTPLAHAIRQKLNRHANELEFLIQQVEQILVEGHTLLHKTPAICGEEVALSIRDSRNPISTAIRGRIASQYVHPYDAGYSVQEEGLNETNSNNKPSECWKASESLCDTLSSDVHDESEILRKGISMLSGLPPQFREAILGGISRAQTPLANAIRQKLVKHASELENLINEVEQTVVESQNLVQKLPPELSEALVATLCCKNNPLSAAIRGTLASTYVLEDPVEVMSPADDESDPERKVRANPQTPTSCEHRCIQEDTGSVQFSEDERTFEGIGNKDSSDVRQDAIVPPGSAMLSLLATDHVESILTEIKKTDSLLANAIRHTLAQHATDINGLIEKVTDVEEGRKSHSYNMEVAVVSNETINGLAGFADGPLAEEFESQVIECPTDSPRLVIPDIYPHKGTGMSGEHLSKELPLQGDEKSDKMKPCSPLISAKAPSIQNGIDPTEVDGPDKLDDLYSAHPDENAIPSDPTLFSDIDFSGGQIGNNSTFPAVENDILGQDDNSGEILYENQNEKNVVEMQTAPEAKCSPLQTPCSLSPVAWHTSTGIAFTSPNEIHESDQTNLCDLSSTGPLYPNTQENSGPKDSSDSSVQKAREMLSNMQPLEMKCPRTDVALYSESWTPGKNMGTTAQISIISKHDDNGPELIEKPSAYDLAISNSVLEQGLGIIDIMQVHDGPVRSARPSTSDFMHSNTHGSRQLETSHLTVEDDLCTSIPKLRSFLRAACICKGISGADQLLIRALNDYNVNKTGSITIQELAAALSIIGIHLRKYIIRPLQKNQTIFCGNLLKINSFLDALNEQEWWPSERDFEANNEFLHNLKLGLDRKFGPRISGMLMAGKDIAHIQSLMRYAEKDEFAVEEMKSFVEATIQNQNVRKIFHETCSPCEKETHGEVHGEVRRDCTSPYFQAAQSTFPPKSLLQKVRLKADRGTSGRSSANSLPDFGSDPRRRYRHVSQDVVDNFKLWSHPTRSKSPGPQAYSYGFAESRMKAREYIEQLGSSGSGYRPVTNNSERFWRRLPFPAHAIEYRKWHLLKETIPGFSDPKLIVPSAPSEAWKNPTAVLARAGSRFRDPLGSGYEQVEKSTIQMSDFKRQRSHINIALEGNDQIREVRKLVARGNFDKALDLAVSALHSFRSSGKFGMSSTNQIGEPISNVAACVKTELTKVLNIASEHLKRKNFQKAMAHIPFLRSGTCWLKNLKANVSPENMGQMAREGWKGIPDITDEVKKIEKLTANVLNAQKINCLAIEAASLASFFAQVRIEFESYESPSQSDVELAEKRRNQLPTQISADGTAYVAVFDVKSADLPVRLQIGTKLRIRGHGVLGTAKKGNGSSERYGLVTAFNESSCKYKIQFADDHQWESWPLSNPLWTVEIDIDPEDVKIDIPGFDVKSKTILMDKISNDNPIVAVVSFVVTPRGPPFDFSVFGLVRASVIGVKSGKSLLQDSDKGFTFVLPPKILLPATKYELTSSTRNESLPDGLIEFEREGNDCKLQFLPGQRIDISQGGTYTICCRGQRHLDSPCLTFSYRTCLVLDSPQVLDRLTPSKMVLNEPLLRSDEMRIVLTWSARPLEFDTHVYTSSGDHTSYNNGSGGDLPREVRIDMDSMTGYGPETATIRVRSAHSYSFSVHYPSEKEGPCDWVGCCATVSLFDASGLFAMFHVPPVKYSSPSGPWWHVFALDGGHWDKPGHGIVRVNKLMGEEMPELSLPAWPLIQAARSGLWDEFSEFLVDKNKRKGKGNLSMIFARDLANLMSLQGETILGLICSHNEDAGEDPSYGNEEGITPLQKQINSLQLFMKYTQKQSTSGESLLNGGLPSVHTFLKECRLRKPTDCFIYRAVAYASTAITVQVLNSLSAVVKRSLPGNGYRQFLEDHGDQLLLACIDKRHWRSVIGVIQALLSIEAVWQRRAMRNFQQDDAVEIENPSGSGIFEDGVVLQKQNNLFRIQLVNNAGVATRDVSLEGNFCEQTDTILHQIPPARLRWRSQIVKRLHELCACLRKQIEWEQSQRDHSSISEELKQLVERESIYNDALILVTEKLFLR